MNNTIRQWFQLALRRPVRAAMIAFWHVAGKRVRARGQLADAILRLPFRYDEWVNDCAVDDAATIGALPSIVDHRSPITVHLHIGAFATDQFRSAIDSVLNQSWPHWRMIITTTAQNVESAGNGFSHDPRVRTVSGYSSQSAALAAALDQADTTYIVPLDGDCRLPPQALLAFAAAIGEHSEQNPPILYGDQDEFSAAGLRFNPWFKPGWDHDMFLAQDYLSAACAIPVMAARRAMAKLIPPDEGSSAVYALLLQMVASASQPVSHLNRVTISTPVGYWQRKCPERLAALQRHLTATSDAKVLEGPFGTAIVQWQLPVREPLVSIVIPTRDRLDLLQPCVEGVLNHTSYRNFEIIIADNGSIEPDTLAFLDRVSSDPRVRVVSWPFPYNYSAINNFAVREATGEFLCLLNNDIEIIDSNWLTELMRHACRDGVGAVGARLLYPDRSIQHAGVVVGMGNAAGHAHRGLPHGEPGYFAHALIAREATAVTAACLVVSRHLFDVVGGLDETDLRIAYNDVDFCLKLRAAGARNIYAPEALLIHHESKSRGLDMATEHLDRYMKELAVLQRRWETTLFMDMTHHRVLDRSSEIYRTP